MKPRILFVLLILFSFSSAAQAELLLGKVSKDKIKSFKNYFGRFYDVEKPVFEDAEFEKRIHSEVLDIHGWIEDDANWPEGLKNNPAVQNDLHDLYSYFGNAGIQTAKDKSVRLKVEAAESDPDNLELQQQMYHYFSRHKDDKHSEEIIRYAKRIAELDRDAAGKDNIFYLLMQSAYQRGNFREAREHLKSQADYDASFEDTATKIFVFDMWVEQWGEVPEKIRFEDDGTGVLVPVPEN